MFDRTCIMEPYRASEYEDQYYIYDDKNRIYILIGETDSFIDKHIYALSDKIELYYIYEISVTDSGISHSFVTSNLLCPIKNSINLMLYKEYSNIVGSCLLNTKEGIIRYTDPDKLFVYVLCYKSNYEIKTLTMIKCHTLLTLPKDINVDGYRVNDLSFFYTDPELIRNMEIENADLLYRNILLRREINKLVVGDYSELQNILSTYIVTVKKEDVWKLIVADELYDTNDITRLVKFRYDSYRFRAFVRAWYSGQLNNCQEDNDKINETYCLIEKVI